MGWQKRTEGEASKMLADYEHLNHDLPDDLLRQMAIFFLAPRVGKESLAQLFDRNLGQTPYRHRSWFWWQAMRTSGLGRYWDHLVEDRNNAVPFRDCLLWLRDQATDDQWEEMSRRVGMPLILPDGEKVINPHRFTYEPDPPTENIWTKGGCWSREEGITQIALLGNHLEDRGYGTAWTERLTADDIHRLETEVYNITNADTHLAPRCWRRAVDYVRRRIPDILGYDVDRTSLHTAAWFYQQPVPDENGYFHEPEPDPPFPRRIREPGVGWIRWEWLPPEESDKDE